MWRGQYGCNVFLDICIFSSFNQSNSLIAKIHNLHRCLTKLGESDCSQRFLLPLSWAQRVCIKCALLQWDTHCRWESRQCIRGLQRFFFSCPVYCTYNQCKKEELVLKTHINSEKHRHVPYTQCMYKSALQRPTVLQEGCVKYYVCCICQKKCTHSPH